MSLRNEILEVINCTLKVSSVSTTLEASVVSSLLKKPSLFSLICYPGSNLVKEMEKMVDAAFWVVLGEEDPFLSEFWCSLGTEIDLVALLEEICQKLEREHTTMLAFLNLSGLFSITKHSTLLSCLTGMNFRSTVFSLLQMIYQKC